MPAAARVVLHHSCQQYLINIFKELQHQSTITGAAGGKSFPLVAARIAARPSRQAVYNPAIDAGHRPAEKLPPWMPAFTSGMALDTAGHDIDKSCCLYGTQLASSDCNVKSRTALTRISGNGG